MAAGTTLREYSDPRLFDREHRENQRHRTVTMSHQYPPPPGGANMSMATPRYNEIEGEVPEQLPHTSFHGIPHHAINDASNHPLALKRSFSMPDTGPIPQDVLDQQANANAQAEKKRNKLGYHRSSMACSMFAMGMVENFGRNTDRCNHS